MGDERMLPDEAAHHIRAHVGELRHHDAVEHVVLAGDVVGRIAREEINQLRNEIEQPEDVEEAEDGEGHRLQRADIAGALEHLPGKDDQQEKEDDRDLEVIGAGRPHPGEIVKAAREENDAADQGEHLEVRELLVIEHPVELPQAEQAQACR